MRHSKVSTVFSDSTDRALFTINTGNFLSQNSRESFKDACRRWGCNYIEITDTDTRYHPAALKLQSFNLCDYERLFVIDADTVIRSDTPNIFDMTTAEGFYAVKNHQPHHPAAYNVNTKIARNEIEEVFKTKGQQPVNVDWISNNFFNAGVEVISRSNHAKILDDAFYLFTGSKLQWWDQIPINIAVMSSLGKYEELPGEWNYQFPVNNSRMQAYVYHYAGNPSRYGILKEVVWQKIPEGIWTRDALPTVINQYGLKHGVEVGTQNGDFAEHLLSNSALDNLTVVDLWKHLDNYADIANVSDTEHEKVMARCINKLQKFGGRATILREDSAKAANAFEDGSLDFVYLDANHSYKGTKRDLEAWYKKVRNGGILAGHDFMDSENYCGSEFGVRSAVLEFLMNTKHTLYVTDEVFKSFWMVKE